MTFEYKMVKFRRGLDDGGIFRDADVLFEARANELGNQGWEIIALMPTAEGFTVFLKREYEHELMVPEPPPDQVLLKVEVSK